MTETATRTDIDRPAEFNPDDYVVIDYLDLKRPEYFPGCPIEVYEEIVAQWRYAIERHFPDHRTEGEGHQSISQCNHCGHPHLRYVAVVEHTPSGRKLAFGEICAERCEIQGRDKFRAKFIKDKAALDKARMENEARRAAFTASAPDVVEFLRGLNTDYDSREPEFLLSLRGQLDRKGELSEAQVEAARKFLVKRQEREARIAAEQEQLKDAPPLAEGKRQIEGEIVSTKIQTSDYGSALKMLVREDDGNKVWGTVPRNIEEISLGRVRYEDAGVDEDGRSFVPVDEGVELPGQRIRFNATVERSNNDEHFGFFKRPIKAELIS